MTAQNCTVKIILHGAIFYSPYYLKKKTIKDFSIAKEIFNGFSFYKINFLFS